MHSTRILSTTLCLALACLLLTGNALAGKTTAPVVKYAKELGKSNQVYTLPSTGGDNFITRSMNVIRNNSQDFKLILTLSGNAEFATDSLPQDGDLTITSGGGVATRTVLSGGKDKDSSVTYLVDITTPFTSLPTLRLATDTWKIRDVDNVLGGGGTVTATIITTDSATDIEFDIGSATVDWLQGADGVIIKPSFASTTATIDVRKARLEFVPSSGAIGVGENDDADEDKGATIGIDASKSGVNGLDGTTYLATVDDKILIVIEGDLGGITEITWDSSATGSNPAPITIKASEAASKGFDATNGKATITIPGNNATINADSDESQITIKVDGKTTLSPRTLTITVKLDLKDGTGGLSANDRDLVGQTTFTVWKLNGTVLIANFMNGNTNTFKGRIYLFNPSSSAGNITIRVFTLPLTGTSTQIGSGTLDLGSLAGTTGKNIRLAEDILTPLAVTLPYLTDAGNMVVEVTVEAAGVTGVGQVFQLDLSSFGIYPLQSVN